MDTKAIVRDAFLKEWSNLKRADSRFPVRRRTFAILSEREEGLIESRFTLDEVDKSLLLEKREKGATFNEKYHTMRLRVLATQFAQYLYLVTDRGRDITLENVALAQDLLAEQSGCSIYPCRTRRSSMYG